MIVTPDNSPYWVDWSKPVNWSHTLNRGLVSWWLAVPNRMGWGSNRWRDLCGRNHGTLTNMDPATDWRGRYAGWGALDFDGSDDYVTVGHSSDLNLTETASTVSFWLNAPHAQPKDFSAFLDKGAGDSLGQHAWVIRPSLSADSGQILVAVEDAQVTFAAGSYPNNEWAHMTVTWDGSDIRLYRNGSLIETIAQPSGTYRSSNTSPFLIGALKPNGAYIQSQAKLDDIQLRSRVLSAAEISALCRLSRHGYPGLLNRVPMPWYAAQGTVTPAIRRYIIGGGFGGPGAIIGA